MAEEEPKHNEEVKDGLFTDLFGRDRTAKENFISLYNALNGTALRPEETELIPETIDNVMYMGIRNDVAMRVNEKVVVLVEHRSTINRNMPLRMLSYQARIYERIVPARKKYYRGIVKVPMPEFYVMYNGTDDYPEKGDMRLSEAFLEPDGVKPARPPLELVVKVHNITPGRGGELLGRCSVLRQYSQFIELVRGMLREKRDEPLKSAVMESIRRGILPEYLERKAIVDNLRVHHGKIVMKWPGNHTKDIEIFYTSPYSPEINPDEYLNHNLKIDVHSRILPRTAKDLHRKTYSFMRRLQNDKSKVQNIFKHRNLAYITKQAA